MLAAPEVPPLCRETLVSRTANVGTVGMNGLRRQVRIPEFQQVLYRLAIVSFSLTARFSNS